MFDHLHPAVVHVPVGLALILPLLVAGMALAHNARTREEVDGIIKEAEAVGAVILKSAADTFWGGYAGYFSDPDGYLWEVAHNPFFWVGPND